MLISIFTPAYNRGHLLFRLYDSLLKQTHVNFEWIVVNDGSNDNTDEIIESFIIENKINIKYYKQKNSGKHTAINRGVEIATGDLFFIVDSDDYLPPDSIEFINDKYNLISNDDSIAGLSGRKGYSNFEVIGSKNKYDNLVASAIDFRFKYNVIGDMAEVVKLSILKQYPFPEIDNEKFCSEGLIWFRIAQKYKFIWFSKIIYIAEYLEGGLSDTSLLARINSPKYTGLLYSELSMARLPCMSKIKYNINYWRFAKYLNESFGTKWKRVNSWHSLLGYPISFIFRFIDR